MIPQLNAEPHSVPYIWWPGPDRLLGGSGVRVSLSTHGGCRIAGAPGAPRTVHSDALLGRLHLLSCNR